MVADRAPAHALSFEAGHPVSTPEADTFVDGVATRTPVPASVAAMVAGAARFVRVSEVAAERAMRILWRTTHHMLANTTTVTEAQSERLLDPFRAARADLRLFESPVDWAAYFVTGLP